MKNKVDSKDYQPIRFHKGKPHLASPGKPGDEIDLNEDDPRRNVVERDDDSEEDKIDKEETTNEEKEREIEKLYEEEDENEKIERVRF